MNSSALMRFGATVRLYREQSGKSQEELAELAGLHRTYIGSIERGERNVGLLNIIRIAEALDVSAADLVAAFSTKRRK
jgi:transcriptional regulator with XRE-family HTH domain